MHLSIIQRISSEYFRIFVLVSGHRYHAFYNIYRYNILHGSLYFSDTGTASGRSAVPGGTEFGDDGGHHRRNGADRSARFFARGDFRPLRRHGRCSGSRAGRRRADLAAAGVSRRIGPHRRSSGGGRHAAARYGRAGGLAPPGLRVSRPPLRLFLPAGQRKTLLQRAGLGELPHSGRTTALPRPADEFPGGGRFDARLLDRTVRTARGSDPRRRTGDQPERYGARSAIVRGRPLVLKRRGGQTIRSTVMSGFARSRSIYPSSAAVPLARITSVARCTTPSGVRAASTS